MILSEKPASIQGAILSLRARQIHPYPPKKDRSLGFRVYPFKLNDSAEAIIKKELLPRNRFLINIDSLLDKDDGIMGEIITGFSGERRIRPKGGIPFSHRHRGRGADTADGKNFAKLDREWKAIHEKRPELPES